MLFTSNCIFHHPEMPTDTKKIANECIFSRASFCASRKISRLKRKTRSFQATKINEPPQQFQHQKINNHKNSNKITFQMTFLLLS